MEMSSMMFVANKSLLDASTTPEQSAADSSATSTCLVDVMMFSAFSDADTTCLHQNKVKIKLIDAPVLAEQKPDTRVYINYHCMYNQRHVLQ